MNLRKKLGFGLLAFAAAMFVTAIPAHAQQLYRGTFSLPFEAQWSNVVLEPGRYTITVEEAPSGFQLIRLHGHGDLTILAATSSQEPVGDNGRLTFVTIDGVYRLSKFEASAIGQSFTFPLHKAKGEKAARTGDAPEATAVVLSTH